MKSLMPRFVSFRAQRIVNPWMRELALCSVFVVVLIAQLSSASHARDQSLIDQAISACPKLLASLICYAGDDLTDDRKNLLECAKSGDCMIDPLQYDEVVFAFDLYKKKVKFADIRRLYDKKFEVCYPFADHPTKIMKAYRASKNSKQHKRGKQDKRTDNKDNHS